MGDRDCKRYDLVIKKATLFWQNTFVYKFCRNCGQSIEIVETPNPDALKLWWWGLYAHYGTIPSGVHAKTPDAIVYGLSEPPSAYDKDYVAVPVNELKKLSDHTNSSDLMTIRLEIIREKLKEFITKAG